MRRVLVVDDEPHIRTVLRGYLQADGFEVAEAADGEAALAAMRDQPPDLVLLDVMLPGIDGLEVLRQLRTFSDVYVILVTARAEEVDKLVGLGVGADDYVTKPFSPREVTARVKAVLRRDRGARTAAGRHAPLRRPDHRPGRPRGRSRTERRWCCPAWSSTCSPRSPQRRGGCSPGRSCSNGCGVTTSTATSGWSTSTSGACGRGWATRRADPHLIATVRGAGYKFVGSPE